MMKRRLFLGLSLFALVAGAAAIGFLYYQANPDEWQSFIDEMGSESSSSAETGPVKEKLRKDGRLEASGFVEVTEITVSAQVGGIVTDIYAEEGQDVSEGELLLQFDDRPLLVQREALAANVQQADAALDAAIAQLEMAVAGPRSEEVSAAEGAVRAAAAQVDLARAGLDAVEAAMALDQGPLTPTEHDLSAARAQVEIAEGQLAQAQAQLVLVSTGATGYDRAILKSQVEQAEAALAAVEAALRAHDIVIESASVQSPLNGIVLQRLFEPGELAAPGAPLFVLADLGELTLTVYIPEADLGLVDIGQSVEVSVDAYDSVFPGTVYHIASSAEFTPRNVQTQEERVHMVFAVKILLNNPDGQLKPGMPADASFAQLDANGESK
jgi:HlyD family secretion protein